MDHYWNCANLGRIYVRECGSTYSWAACLDTTNEELRLLCTSNDKKDVFVRLVSGWMFCNYPLMFDGTTIECINKYLKSDDPKSLTLTCEKEMIKEHNGTWWLEEKPKR